MILGFKFLNNLNRGSTHPVRYVTFSGLGYMFACIENAEHLRQECRNEQQVAQRATIAHLTISHQNI